MFNKICEIGENQYKNKLILYRENTVRRSKPEPTKNDHEHLHANYVFDFKVIQR